MPGQHERTRRSRPARPLQMRRAGVRIPSAPLIGTLSDLRKRRRMGRVSCYMSRSACAPMVPRSASAAHALHWFSMCVSLSRAAVGAPRSPQSTAALSWMRLAVNSTSVRLQSFRSSFAARLYWNRTSCRCAFPVQDCEPCRRGENASSGGSPFDAKRAPAATMRLRTSLRRANGHPCFVPSTGQSGRAAGNRPQLARATGSTVTRPGGVRQAAVRR